MKRSAQSIPDSNESSVGSKRVMSRTLFDVHRAESSHQHQHLEGAPTLDPRRAEKSRQHVRALNTQFTSWVQSQLQNHPDELWEDGVQDYLKHASNILENYKDVVDWLKANAAKAESVPLTAPSAEKTPLTEAKANEINSQLNAKSGFACDGATPSVANSWSFNLLPRGQTSVLSGSQNGTPFNQTSVLPGSQSATAFKQDASDDPDGENDLEKPSSPSVKKTEEQGVLVVHEVKCKVYVKPENPADGAWKDMGMGQLSVKCREGASKATKESKPTVVVRNDVGKLLLNALLYPGIKMNIQKNTITTIFHTLAAGQVGGNEAGKDAVAAARTYLLRMKTVEETSKLAEAIKEYAPTA
ncbi:hypothetical protein MRB53_025638 [Persea americana]|uniref:Uncharacterized protein n=1 Tax=Persea americana TaxID=3435 RepID=A0ACC2LG03_PERAE|nr:hypothetical protein MRB53_025638 [Persea americana]|eukprot:TRINITY_DN20021_c0_g1_i1.p1 TRINITY_DN20021_c0_g1~~TRINITY_DN20021_c0_g1_i1.p1  ORF type:complete len:357 (-),score=87.26 TRINITY_DN20021_c0_g1_i1:324-1394(-)